MQLLNTKANVRWAAAGRSRDKLQGPSRIELSYITSWSLVDCLRKAGCPESTPIVLADVDDAASLDAMCQRATVVLDCVGPYVLYGKPVVQACLRQRTDYIDITGEPTYIAMLMEKYHQQALNSGVTLVPACGFDSIPSDIGVMFAKQQVQLQGLRPLAVELFVQVHSGPSGITVNIGTFASMLQIMSDPGSMKPLKQKSNRLSVPQVIRSVSWPHYDRRVGLYVVPFQSVDPMLVQLSQEECQERYQDPPVQCAAYMGFPSIWQLLGVGLGVAWLALMSQFEWSRCMLMKHTERLTLGYFSHQGPTPQQIKETSFTTTIVVHAQNEQGQLVQRRMVVHGPEMAYVTTPICAVNAALVLSQQKSKVPAGVLTSATAFRNTDLVDRLQADGLLMALQ